MLNGDVKSQTCWIQMYDLLFTDKTREKHELMMLLLKIVRQTTAMKDPIT